MGSFLGSCEVCGKSVRNNRALSQHFRFNPDPEHLALRERWRQGRAQYRGYPECRKCGGVWEVQDPKKVHRKRCPSCQELRNRLGKRRYEKTQVQHPTLPEVISRPQPEDICNWQKGDPLYREVASGYRAGETVGGLTRRLGIPYKTFKAIAEDHFGVGGYRELAALRKKVACTANIQKAHQAWNAMTPEQKAAEIKRRFGGGSALERGFGETLAAQGYSHVLNDWISLDFEGVWRPREADIKVILGKQKLVVLCDGEAFHGPGYIFGDARARIADDVQTAQGFYTLGYSVVRYSESEIHSGWALAHLGRSATRIAAGERMLRLWHPLREEWG